MIAVPGIINLAFSMATASRGMSQVRAPARKPAPLAVRLLLVDDCRINRMLVTAVLTRWGIVPTIACDGAQAVLIAERQSFDIVLMDLLMPVMDGVVATAKIRQAERENPLRAQVPIVAYTSLDLSADPMRMARVGWTAVLPKPCSASTLRACLTRWCPDRFVGHAHAAQQHRCGGCTPHQDFSDSDLCADLQPARCACATVHT
jgi:CheY-like chemotaxis protein